ncbi:MAG: hypothetical protein IKU54_05980 [Oscillospiraceae bacterium]|nr:hypothetical protein [Oscillospiraceae bacterium]
MFEKLAKNSAAVIMLVLFSLLYGNILVYKGSVKYILLAVFYAVTIFVLYIILEKSGKFLTPARTRIITTLIWAAIVFGGGFVVYGFREYMIIDMKEVYDSAWHLVRNGSLGERSWYFIRCKNNFGFLLLSYLVHETGFRWFGIAQNTERSVNFVTYVNFAFVLFAMWLTVYVIRKINPKPSVHILSLVIVGSYLPFYLWSPVFYTDTVTMFFPPLMLYMYYRFTTTDSDIIRVIISAVAGLLCMAGYALKGSVPILLIAFLIMLVIGTVKSNWKNTIICCVAAVMAFAVSYKAYDRYYYSGDIVDFSTRQENELPLELWFLFASHQPAEWYMEEYNYMLSLPDIETRKAEAVRMIKENYSSYSLTELVQFIRDKNMLIWGEETFTGLDYLYNAYTGSWTHNFIIPGYPYYALFRYLCNSVHLGTLMLFILSIFTEFFKKKADIYTMAKITLTGALIFLSFWERNARYVLTFTPLILMCATELIYSITSVFTQKLKK